jgi:hypothetical protein
MSDESMIESCHAEGVVALACAAVARARRPETTIGAEVLRDWTSTVETFAFALHKLTSDLAKLRMTARFDAARGKTITTRLEMECAGRLADLAGGGVEDMLRSVLAGNLLNEADTAAPQLYSLLGEIQSMSVTLLKTTLENGLPSLQSE